MTSLNDQSTRLVCRYCGHNDNLTHCSRCGLPLDPQVETGLDYVRDRARRVLDVILQFLFTFLPLLIRPDVFFRRLASDDLAMDGPQIILSRGVEPSFKPWRRPMTAGVYLITTILLVAVAARVGGFEETLLGIIENILGTSDISENDVALDIAVKTGLIVLELVFVATLFLLLSIYRRIIGSVHDFSRVLVDYFLYCGAQAVLCLVASTLLANILSVDGFAVALLAFIVFVALL